MEALVTMAKRAKSWMYMCRNRVGEEVGRCEESMGQGKGCVPLQGFQSHGVKEVKATNVMP